MPRPSARASTPPPTRRAASSISCSAHGRITTPTAASDGLTIGCDRFGGTDFATCNAALQNYQSSFYDFFTFQAPVDSRLPGGGGYVVTGLADVKASVAAPVTVQTYQDQLKYTWSG